MRSFYRTRRSPAQLAADNAGKPTRIQLRGICQICGRDQAVPTIHPHGAVIVKHGYRRPGDGATHGRCPGQGHLALNITDAYTREFLAGQETQLAQLVATQPKLERLVVRTEQAHQSSTEPAAYACSHAMPRKPMGYTPGYAEKYPVLLAEWEAKYPLYVAMRNASESAAMGRMAISQTQSFIEHLTGLINSKTVGKPFTKVTKVVAK